MTPEQLSAWIQVAQLATGVIGAGIGTVLGWIKAAHPALDPTALAAAYKALLDDALVRENIARQMAGLPPATS